MRCLESNILNLPCIVPYVERLQNFLLQLAKSCKKYIKNRKVKPLLYLCPFFFPLQKKHIPLLHTWKKKETVLLPLS